MTENIVQVLMEARASMRPQGYKTLCSGSGALLMLWGEISLALPTSSLVGTSILLLLKSAAKLGFTGVKWAGEV